MGGVGTTLNSCHSEFNTRVTALSAGFSVIEVTPRVTIQFATVALTKLGTKCVLNVDNEKSRPNDSSSSVEPSCATADVNIVEEEQKMWRRVEKKGTKLQLNTGRRGASQQVRPHLVAESLITMTVIKRSHPDTCDKHFLPRTRKRDQPEPELTAKRGAKKRLQVFAKCTPFTPSLESYAFQSCTCHWRQRGCSSRTTAAAMRCLRESKSSWTPLACTTSHRQRVW